MRRPALALLLLSSLTTACAEQAEPDNDRDEDVDDNPGDGDTDVPTPTYQVGLFQTYSEGGGLELVARGTATNAPSDAQEKIVVSASNAPRIPDATTFSYGDETERTINTIWSLNAFQVAGIDLGRLLDSDVSLTLVDDAGSVLATAAPTHPNFAWDSTAFPAGVELDGEYGSLEIGADGKAEVTFMLAHDADKEIGLAVYRGQSNVEPAASGYGWTMFRMKGQNLFLAGVFDSELTVNGVKHALPPLHFVDDLGSPLPTADF